jgi:hypothetical protein
MTKLIILCGVYAAGLMLVQGCAGLPKKRVVEPSVPSSNAQAETEITKLTNHGL